MPDKQNENKFMAMLERRGIVRRAGEDDAQSETNPEISQSRTDTDIRAILNNPAGNAPTVTPVARQPVPGMSNPIIPSEKPQNVEREQQKREQPQATEPRTAEPPRAEQPRVAEPPKVEPPRAEPPRAEPPRAEPSKAVEPPKAERPMVAEAPRTEQPRTAAPVQQTASPGGFGSFSDGAPRNEFTASNDGFGAPEIRQQQPSPEDYTDRYLDIEDLYEVLSLKSKRTDTIYLVEEYLKTLPDSLPDESRREIVGKIVSASGFNYDLLMGDGVLRVKMLKEYAERFARHTDDYVAARQAELDELDRQILRVRKLVEDRRELHKKQFFAIEAEAQRLKDILTFISG